MGILPSCYYLVVKNGIVQGTFTSRYDVIQSFGPVVDDNGAIHIFGSEGVASYVLLPRAGGYLKREALADFAGTSRFTQLARAKGIEVHRCIVG